MKINNFQAKSPTSKQGSQFSKGEEINKFTSPEPGNPNADFVVMNGNRAMIKRKIFELYIDKAIYNRG